MALLRVGVLTATVLVCNGVWVVSCFVLVAESWMALGCIPYIQKKKMVKKVR